MWLLCTVTQARVVQEHSLAVILYIADSHRTLKKRLHTMVGKDLSMEKASLSLARCAMSSILRKCISER